MMKWKPILGKFVKARLEPENEFDKFEAAVEKKLYCGWIFIKKKSWSIRKNYFIFSSWKQ